MLAPRLLCGNCSKKRYRDEALQRLVEVEVRKGQVVELRFFVRLTEEETAEALTVSRETVRRDWRLAESWLLRAS